MATLAATKKEYRDSGLQDNTAYYYRLVPLSAVGLAGLPSKVRESMTAPTPEPPAAVRAEAPASRAVCVTWTASPSEGVVRYVVERAPADSDQFVKVGAVEKTMFREGGEAGTDLRDSTKYLYRLTAINRVGAVGTPSQPVEVVTRPPPAPVTGLSAASGEVRCVSVAWTPSPETDVVRYDVYRCDATNAAFTLVKSIKGRTTTSFLDGGRDPGNLADQSAYEYKVRAINAVGAESADHEPVKAVTRGAPPVVAGLVAKSGQPRQVSLAWELSPDQKVVGYEIQRAAQGEAAPARIAEVSGREKDNFIDRGGSRWFSGGLGTLPDGTEYRYQVIAFNTARVCSPPTAPVSARTKPVPVAPSGLSTTTNLPKSVKITFRANPEKDIVCYVVEAAADAAGKFRELVRVDPTAEDALACTEAKLSDGAPRCYRIKAVDRDTLESPWSEVVAGATKPLPPPPADVRAEWKDDAAVLTWTASAAQDVKAYKVWKKSFFSAEVVATVAGPECRLTRAQVEKKINVFISAVDADGLESEHSAVLAVAPPPPPK
ncbi:MAG: hypothetical protein NTV49_03555 [Kiritimatiellaeota bacterium]|nr:hypothetical protein [Kiritimatiellota bacterium]